MPPGMAAQLLMRDFPAGPLAVGDDAPPSEAEGWLNGAPDAGNGSRLMVIDLWAPW